MTGSESSKADILRDFKVPPETSGWFRWAWIRGCFTRRPAPRVPGRIVAVASADSPVKGVATLLRAYAKLITDREAELIWSAS